MESRAAAERASSDAKAAVAAYGVPAAWLTTAHPVSGLQLAGLAAGALVVGAAISSLLQRTPQISTPADRVTLLRAVLASLCAVLAVPALFTGRPAGPLLVVLGGAAFLLDAVDGPVARRTGTASAAGARFDAATDAALVLVLSTATAAQVGLWALGIGLLYYVFVAAGCFWPHLRAPLPRRSSRKAIGAFQPFALLVALVPGVPPVAATGALAVALLSLLFSFTRDVVELEHHRRRRHPAAPVPRLRTPRS